MNKKNFNYITEESVFIQVVKNEVQKNLKNVLSIELSWSHYSKFVKSIKNNQLVHFFFYGSKLTI